MKLIIANLMLAATLPLCAQTAQDQSNSKPDVETTRVIRREITKTKGMSVSARNITIVTAGGVVNLKGSVRSMDEKMKMVEMDGAMLTRSVNTGFSGGEKKRNEILQMAVLEPTLAILDETDSGLDIDALRIVAGGVNALKRADRATIVVTHYQRLLNYIVPDFVHVLANGRIVRSGGKELALALEEKGYDWLLDGAVA